MYIDESEYLKLNEHNLKNMENFKPVFQTIKYSFIHYMNTLCLC